jgi:hypothetical protein
MPAPSDEIEHKPDIDENYFPFEVISISLAYRLNPPHPSLKYAIQFILIDIPQYLLQVVRKLVLISHPNPLELFSL